MIQLSEKEKQRFFDKISKGKDCWLWTDVPAANGYGYLGIGGRAGRKIQAHRISYELHKGEIPAGLHIDHKCRVRNCVNPDHLEAVTQKVNLLRGEGIGAKNAVKTHCSRGHAFDTKNTIWKKNGARQCRKCANLTRRIKRQSKINHANS